MERIGENGELDLSLVRPAKEISQGYTAMLDGDVVVAKITPCFENGKGALCKDLQGGVGFGTTELIVLRAKQKTAPRFLYWLTRSHEFRKWGEAEMIGSAGQKRVTEGFVSNFRSTELSPSLQRRIAAYLDEQTAKIDRLMVMRRRQMELLKEQRAALIQQAVTRGLNPAAPMRDSGIPWLGEVPAHWEVKRLRFIIENGLVNGLFKKNDQFGSGAKLVNVFDIYRDDFIVDIENLERVEVSKAEKNSFSVEQGDLFFVRSSLKAEGIARAACMGFVTESTVYECHLVKARPKKSKINPIFLSLFLNINLVRSRLISLSKTTTMTTIEQMKLADIEVPILPLNEQKSILDFIVSENSKFEALHASYTRQLTLLAEYRTALIHECVTGKRLVTQRTEVEASPTKANVHFLRAVLCSEIVHRLHEEPTFGRVKLEKILFLSEAYAGIDLEGHYQRAAAGPFDNRALRSAESQIQKQKWYQPVKGEKGTRYIPMAKAGEHRKYFSRYWPEQQPKFDRIVDLLRKEKTEFCEIVATLFSAWKDRLHSGQPCDDAALADEVLTNWHPSKQRIPREHWLNALEWMRKQGLTPTIATSPPKE
ncbi:MAG: restriction endonuclease subunit S [Deltaproteobacteria bacterium]|nr:restriction endonuclease subunit S [Deltaproteobacteria bacterium]